MSVLNGRGRGDLVTRILVETPTKLTKEQKAILEQFRETETGDECPASKGFFSGSRTCWAASGSSSPAQLHRDNSARTGSAAARTARRSAARSWRW